MTPPTRDLDDAYANMVHIPDGASYPEKWAKQAEAFRATVPVERNLRYGAGEREVFDLFRPEGTAAGLVVFVHGGYWLKFSKDDWSHLAAGALARGWAVAIPSYTLAPDARITDIGRQIESAIGAAAALVDGPIRICGHSAGGHLTARMLCDDYASDWRPRLERAIPISPISDLGPLMRTSMNDKLQITRTEAALESPVRHMPCGLPTTIWVGGSERPVFLDQARWLADAWGCGLVIEDGRHHFDVVEALADPESLLTRELLL